MSAYVIGDINVTDPDTFAKYAGLVPASSGAFGGRYLVRDPTNVSHAKAIGTRSDLCWLSIKT